MMEKVELRVSIERIIEKLLAADGGIALMSLKGKDENQLPVFGDGERKLLGSLAWIQVPGTVLELSEWLEEYSMEGEMSSTGEVKIALRVQTRKAKQILMTGAGIIEDIVFLKVMCELLRGIRQEQSEEYCRRAIERTRGLKILAGRVAPGTYRHRPTWY